MSFPRSLSSAPRPVSLRRAKRRSNLRVGGRQAEQREIAAPSLRAAWRMARNDRLRELGLRGLNSRSPQQRHAAGVLPPALGEAQRQRSLLLNQCREVSGSQPVSIGYRHASENDGVPFPHGGLVPVRALAAGIPAKRTCLAQVIYALYDLYQGIGLGLQRFLDLARQSVEGFSPVESLQGQKRLTHDVVRAKSQFCWFLAGCHRSPLLNSFGRNATLYNSNIPAGGLGPLNLAEVREHNVAGVSYVCQDGAPGYEEGPRGSVLNVGTNKLKPLDSATIVVRN